MLFALFEEHDGDTVFDRVAKPIAAIDEPFFAIGIADEFDGTFVARVSQNSQQIGADRTI